MEVRLDEFRHKREVLEKKKKRELEILRPYEHRTNPVYRVFSINQREQVEDIEKQIKDIEKEIKELAKQ